MRWGRGDHNAKLAQRTAGILIPFMFIVIQNTVNQSTAEGFSGLSAVFHYRDESDFVLEIYGRIDAGEATGDPAVIDKVRHLYFAI